MCIQFFIYRSLYSLLEVQQMDRLCGGTFFVLLSNARKTMPSKNELIKGISSGLTEQDLMLSLAHLVYPEIREPMETEKRTVQNGVTNFKSCKNWGGSFFHLNDRSAKATFKLRFNENYSELLNEMEELVNKYIETNTSAKKDEYLVKALIETIIQDEGIDYNQEFNIGKIVTRKEFDRIKDINLSAFLLGIWYFVLTEIENIKIGQETFERWCPKQSGGRREYKQTIGETSKLQINLSYSIIDNKEKSVPVTEKALNKNKTSYEVISERIMATGQVMADTFGAAMDALAADMQKTSLPQLPEIKAEELNDILVGFSREYYQLIITNSKIFNVKYVDIPLDRVLKSSAVPEEIRNRCSSFTKEGKAELLTFPAIICNENTDYNGKTDTDQLAIFAQITKIKKGEKEVRFYFKPIALFNQAKLNEYSIDYGISTSNTLATLNTTQMTVRAVDLFEAFEDSDVNTPIPPDKTSEIDSVKYYFGKEEISESDYKYLQSFYEDYDALIQKCIKTDFAEQWIDIDLYDIIDSLYQEKWDLASTKLRNSNLRKYIFDVLATLNTLCIYLTPEYLFLLPDRKHLRMIHDTFDDDIRNDTVFRPATHHIRLKLRNLYVKLHPEDYQEITSYEEAFLDWSEGEKDLISYEL